MSRHVIAGFALAALAACSSAAPGLPPNVSTSPAYDDRGLQVPMSLPQSPPQIVHIAYVPSVTRGPRERFAGTILASSNVASVEVRTNLFSINTRKRAPGRFTFDVAVYDLPPIFVRRYTLRVIARTTAGVEAEEDLPFRIR